MNHYLQVVSVAALALQCLLGKSRVTLRCGRLGSSARGSRRWLAAVLALTT